MKNLKKSALILCLFAFSKMFAQNAPEVQFEIMSIETPVEELSYEHLLAHKVFLREKPSLKGKKVAVLDIGTKLVLREKSLYDTEINGIKSNWYRVNTGDQTGWIWGGMIAQKAFGSEADYKVKFVYGYESSTINEMGVAETKYQLRAFKNGFQLDKIVLDSLAAVPSEIMNIGNKGIFNVEDIITLGLVDTKSGREIGKSYIFWNNGKFTNVANLIDYSDASYSKTETFVFPSDMRGIKSTIKLRTVILDKKMAPENALANGTKKFSTSFYTWNGYKLSLKAETSQISKNVVASNTNSNF